MKIHPCLKTISRFLDNWISESKTQNIIRHLKTCERCKEKVDLLRSVESIVTHGKIVDKKLTAAITNNLPEVRRTRQPNIGVIQGIIGTVIVSPDNEEEREEGFIGMGVKQGDTMKLLEKSVALIEMADGSSLWLNKSTEMNFKTGTQNLALHAGEIFAMMKPQREPFIIKTPSAVLSVIGTDFDARIKDGKKTVLSVLKGKVAFQNNTGKTIVTRGHQLEADKHSKLSLAKIQDPGSISRWTGPVKVSRKRGKISIKTLSYVSFVAALLLFGVFFMKGRNHGAGSSTISHETPFDNNAPLKLSSPFLKKGLSLRTRIDKDKLVSRTGEYKDYAESVTRTDILDIDAQGEVRVILTIEDIKLQFDNPGEKLLQVVADMRGRQFSYLVSRDGRIHSIDIFEGKALTIDEFRVFFFIFLDSNIRFLFSSDILTPGDTWTSRLDQNFPGYPDSYIRLKDGMRFKKYENTGGCWTAVLERQYTGSIGGGIPMSENQRNNATQLKIVDNLSIGGTAEYVVDVQSGRLVKGTSTDYERDLKGRIEFHAPNRPVESRSWDRTIDNRFLNNITYEYDPPEFPGNPME